MPRAKFPKPWQPTGSGSYREEREGVFRLNYRPHGTRGKRINRLVACSEEEARAKLATASLNRSRSRAGLPVATNWTDAIDSYKARLSAKRVKPKYQTHALALIESLKDFVAGVDLGDVRAHQIQDWIDARAKALQADGFAGWARTANKEMDMVRAFFNRMRKQGLTENDPISAVDKFRERKLPPRDLTPEEYALAWHKAVPSVRDLMDFFLITGARFSEVAGLRWQHITPDGRWICTDRKGHDFLKLQLDPHLLAIIARQPKEKHGFIFTRRALRGGEAIDNRSHNFKHAEPIGVEWWNDLLQALAKKAGIPIFGGHDLRHAAGSWAEQAGCSPWFIKSLLKHADIRTTMIYAHGNVTEGTIVVQKTLYEMRTKALEGKQA